MSRLLAKVLRKFSLLSVLCACLSLADPGCFWPDGESMSTPYRLCNQTSIKPNNACCPTPRKCANYGLCQDESGVYAGGCTNSGWRSPGCSTLCIGAYARSQIQSCSKAQDISSITEFLGMYTCGPLIAVDPDQDVSHECMLRNFTLNGRVLLGEEDSVGTGSGSPLAAQSTTQSLITQTALSVVDASEISVLPVTMQSLSTQTASRETSIMPATRQSLTTRTASSVVDARGTSVIGRSAEPTHPPKHSSTPHSTTQPLTTQTASSVVDAKETSRILSSQGTEPTRSPKHSSIPHSIAIGAGIAIPVALIALSPLGLYLLTKRRRRKQAEQSAAAIAKASTKRKTPPRWSKDMLDSTNIYELDGRGTVQELDSRAIGAMEILSNPIHEAGEQRPVSIRDRPGGHRPSWIKAWRMSLRRSMVKNRFTF